MSPRAVAEGAAGTPSSPQGPAVPCPGAPANSAAALSKHLQASEGTRSLI